MAGTQSINAHVAQDTGPSLRIDMFDYDAAKVAVPLSLASGGNWPTLASNYTYGAGPNQVNKCWYVASRQLAPAASDSWIIAGGGANVSDRFGNQLSFAAIKYLLLQITPVAGVYLTLGNASPQAWAGWWGGGAVLLKCRHWLQFDDPIDGAAAIAGDAIKVANPSAQNVSYSMLALGI